jgi:hypothetical protein
MFPQKSQKTPFLVISAKLNPDSIRYHESRFFNWLQNFWTPEPASDFDPALTQEHRAAGRLPFLCVFTERHLTGQAEYRNFE